MAHFLLQLSLDVLVFPWQQNNMFVALSISSLKSNKPQLKSYFCGFKQTNYVTSVMCISNKLYPPVLIINLNLGICIMGYIDNGWNGNTPWTYDITSGSYGS
jgi:hypothetical protein